MDVICYRIHLLSCPDGACRCVPARSRQHPACYGFPQVLHRRLSDRFHGQLASAEEISQSEAQQQSYTRYDDCSLSDKIDGTQFSLGFFDFAADLISVCAQLASTSLKFG